VKTWKAHNLSESLTAGLMLLGGALAVVALMVLAVGMAVGMLKTSLPPGAAEMGTEALAAAVKAVNGIRWQGAGFLAGIALLVLLVVGIKFAEKKLDFRFDADDVSQHWLISTTAGFLMMSVVLVGLANIKGDLQDAFIQKVKFISSHGLFAIWIGYGLAFGLTVGNRLLKELVGRGKLAEGLLKPLRTGMVCAGLLVVAIPIYENYNNEYLVFSMSGAEQNGHDFGWQFGNYQLRGADAVIEELDADEEPLPNPLFPQEMEPHAFFFGGTDPGRFVPTYMIYSANVRPDVYLVTQNALADNTYMNTMRDLYGNDLWIPTPDDSAKAFQIYVDEVQAGKRPKNADLTIENGRVQVSGALGVMEINGILCDMIFQKNKARHAFYIEESYVINWMFPYLTPHGLIMKINAEKMPFDRAAARDDLLFWDWYTRHLLRSPMFRRDLPAQKSFSKLRSAIAGLYVARGMPAEGERAFQEARTLYPVSPEANFRLIQEVLLRQARYTEAIDILDEYNRRDPNNGRGEEFVKFIRRIRDTEARVRELTAKLKADKTLAPDDVFALAMAYRELGQNEAAATYLLQLTAVPGLPLEKQFELATLLGSLGKHTEAVKVMDGVMEQTQGNLPSPQLLAAVRVYGEANQPDKMQVPLSRHLQLKPNDWNAWLDMASLWALKQQPQQFQAALQKALELGKGQALQRIQEQPLLRQAAAPVLQRMMQQQGPVGLPGLGSRGQ
jgi:tetratricopeptide (TPR) repeat protein